MLTSCKHLSGANMNEIHRLGSGNISVFLRPLKKGDFYYARYKISNKKLSNGQRYLTETLDTNNLSHALDKARNRFAEISFLEKQGLALRSRTVAAEIDSFVHDYQNGVQQNLSGFSAGMLRGFRKTIVRYFKEYIGNKPLQEVSHQDLVNYEPWRQNYWSKIKEKSKTMPPNARERASERTLAWEINAFKQFLRWCKTKGVYSGHATEFKFARTTNRGTRSSFTTTQWNKLLGFMRRAAWFKVGKMKNDSRIIRHRKLLKTYILFMANTGLRVGEARHLQWEHITFVKGNTEEENRLKIWIRASTSKVRKLREVIGTEGAYNALYQLHQDRTHAQDFCSPTDHIWVDTDGSVINEFRESFNNLIRDAGVEHDPEGKKMTIYSLRHTYITRRLQAGVDIYQLAGNTGTSVEMIQQYYDHARSTDFATELNKGYRKAPQEKKPRNPKKRAQPTRKYR